MAPTAIESLPAKRSSGTRSTVYPRFLIFSTSLLLRGLLGALFFGSVDVVNSATNSLALLAGGQVHLPYLPTINAFLWLGGIIATLFPILLPLSLKLVPILFDSLLAVLIFDLVRHSQPRLALRAGLLYAFSPVAILITSFHGQWDAIALFFLMLAFGLLQDERRGTRKDLAFGVLFGISLLIKPIGLPFLLLFPARKGGKGSVNWPVTGLGALLGIAFTVFLIYGYSLLDTFILIFCYSAKGAQEFGLPFSPMLSHFHIQFYRLYWIVPAIVGMGYLYRRGRVTAWDAMLLFYLYCIGTTGISPQYLLWPLPLLLITKRLRLAAFYTAIAAAFLLFFYSNPWASYFNFENLGVFAPLRDFSWLLPPQVLETREFLLVVRALGDIAIPACAMVIGTFVIRSKPGRTAEERDNANEPFWTRSAARRYAALPLLLFAGILACKLAVHAGELHSRLAGIWKATPGAYALHIQWMDPRIVVTRELAGHTPLNVVALLALFTAIWCGCAACAQRLNGATD